MLNYVDISKGFTRLLKKGIPLLWDEMSHISFNALKRALISAPILHPPNYHRDYYMYLDFADNIIGMVLVQDDDDG